MLVMGSVNGTLDEGARVAPLNLDFGAAFEPQIQAYFKRLGAKGPELAEVVLTGQSVGAVLALPIIEMLAGGHLPQIALIPFGVDAIAGWLNAATFRHDVVRPRRAEIPQGAESFDGFTVIDGAGRGLTPEQLIELSSVLGYAPSDVRVFSAPMGQVDLTSADSATAGVVDRVLSLGLTAGDWAAGRVLYLPPGAGIAAAIQALAIYGLSEVWPQTIRLAQGEDRGFHVRELVTPQQQRQWAMGLLRRLEEGVPVMTLSGVFTSEARSEIVALAKRHKIEIRD